MRGNSVTGSEMFLIQEKRINSDSCQLGILGATVDRENRRIPFNLRGLLSAILEWRATLGPGAFLFDGTHGRCQWTIQTA
jgi:hypothetical protein